MTEVYAATLAAKELPANNILRLDAQFLVELGIQLFNIIALVILLYLLLYKPMRRFMDTRDQRIQTRLENAAQEEARATQRSARTGCREPAPTPSWSVSTSPGSRCRRGAPAPAAA